MSAGSGGTGTEGGTGGGTLTGGIGGTTGSGGTPAGGFGGAAGAGGQAQAGDMGNGGSSAGAGTGVGGGTFSIESPAFDAVAGCSLENPASCNVFPDENVSYMERPNISPELRWTGAPAGTQSFAIVLFDVSFGQAHWVIWNIPASVTKLDANVPKDTSTPASPAGARQANAIFATQGGNGYFGPHIPCNVFQFEIYALSIGTFSPMEPESAALVYIEMEALGDSVLGFAKLTGRSNDYMMTCE